MREIDLPAYFERVGLTQAPAADEDGLAVLQRAHLLSIPFENLDIRLGRGIGLDPAQVFDKLVVQGRGGYCFEHNLLFLGVLRTLGFQAWPLIGRVWLNARDRDDVPALTHRLNLVEIGKRQWIADAGFGGSLAPILPLEPGATATTSDGVTHRLRIDADHGWMMERDAGERFLPQYSFFDRAAWPMDFVIANHFTATAPDTLFTTRHIVSLPNTAGFVSLVDRRLRISASETREIADAEDYCETLSRYFGIELPLDAIGGLELFNGAPA